MSNECYIRIERSDDLEFVRKAVTAAGRMWISASVVGTPGFEMMERLTQALAQPITDLSTPTEQSLHVDAPIKRRRARRTSAEIEAEEYIPNLCKTHPKYQAKRLPRNGCESCWAQYERFNPEMARRAKLKLARERGE